jgi:DNA-binding response OmpR family regulator
MASAERQKVHRVLLVDDDAAVRNMMRLTLESKGFDVVSAADVPEALKYITAEAFDILITDLHMPNPGDGFTVISAMRHSQPNALTMLVSGYPDVQNAMAAILLEADEIVVKPFVVSELTELLRQKVLGRRPVVRVAKESVGAVLERCIPVVVGDWLKRAKKSHGLNHLQLSDEERTGYLPKLVEDLVARLSAGLATGAETDAFYSASAVAHGKLRYQQGYTPAMLVQESRILQVTLFGTLQSNLNVLDFSLVLPDVMTIADEVDAQLTQAMSGYMELAMPPKALRAIHSATA